MKKIHLTQGKVAIVDESDFEHLSKFKWFAVECHINKFYAARKENKKNLYMHREILGLEGKQVHCDHINGDSLDNRRTNIRACTPSENGRNRTLPSNNTSGFKGVSHYKNFGKWGARIKIYGKPKHLGIFDDPEKAAKAYDAAAVLIHGEFAKTNF